ncbi:MAG: ABC transporter permease [Hyphomicrobiaceae bacterium]|nr:ABC transporter permease [Hyphomicrobiaceae bacterium]
MALNDMGPPDLKRAERRTRLFMIFLGLVFLATFLTILDWNLLERYGPRFLRGVGVTFKLVLISVGIGSAVALPVALARLSANRLVNNLALGYITFFRGTPLLAQLFLVYYGTGQFREAMEAVNLWWFFRDPFFCAALTFTLNTTAYQAEILRGAIQSVPKGQWEAGHALGLSRAVTFLKVILPQAYIIALRPLGNELILMIKGSAVASVVTVFDIMGTTRLAFSRSFDFQVYLWAAVLYLFIVETIRIAWSFIERRLTRHLRVSRS